MFMFERTSLVIAFVFVANLATAADSPQLGQPISEADIAAWDISIGPDGKGLPPGRGTVAQGETVYVDKCQACHGEKGAGRPNDALVGGAGSLPGDRPALKTVGSFWPYSTTFFDYVRRSMPWTSPKTLTNDEVYAVAAYVFNLNGIIKADEVMDAQTLAKVQMPNREGFTAFPRALKVE